MDDILKCIFLNKNAWFRLIFLWNLFLKFELTYSSIGSDKGLALTWRQAIIWTHDG